MRWGLSFGNPNINFDIVRAVKFSPDDKYIAAALTENYGNEELGIAIIDAYDGALLKMFRDSSPTNKFWINTDGLLWDPSNLNLFMSFNQTFKWTLIKIDPFSAVPTGQITLTTKFKL